MMFFLSEIEFPFPIDFRGQGSSVRFLNSTVRNHSFDDFFVISRNVVLRRIKDSLVMAT